MKMMAVVLALVAVTAAGQAVVQRLAPTQGSAVEALIAAGPIEFPDRATDGVLLVEIPRGAYEAFARNERGYLVPSLIWLDQGDRIEIRNNDTGAHMIFFAFVPPGATATMVFDTPGFYTYSSGCAVNPAMNSFSTVVVKA